MKSLNDTDFKIVWEVLRKNKFRFAFQNGSLMWGLPTCIFGLVFTTTIWDDMPLTLPRMLIGVIVFILSGYLMGLTMYATNEKRYSALNSNNS